MKKTILSLLFCLVTHLIFSQVPQAMSYQAIAYNTNNTPATIVTTPVSLRISIRDLSGTGTIKYREIHNGVQPDNQGVFNLNIGMGTAVSPYNTPQTNFSALNWVVAKFLEVEMDIANGTNFVSVGTNQLMSVPYALYAKNSSGMEMIENIATLRTKTGKIGEVVYIKKHTFEKDGGEGVFFWRDDIPTNTVMCDDNDGTIIRPSNALPGAWIRSIEGRINVNYFGTYGNSQSTDGDKIQKAIDFAYNNQFQWGYTNAGTTVYIPTGRYVISNTLILKSGVSIEGDNVNNTILVANNAIKKDGAMIEMAAGQVVGVNVSNLTLLGDVLPSNPDSGSNGITKNCMYLRAQAGSTGDGGLWSASFKNILISQFNGSGIVLQGGGFDTQTYNLTNQAILFENVGVFRQQHSTPCLLIQGEHGQLTFINSGFDGLVYDKNGADFKTTEYFNVVIESKVVQPAVIKFLTCTFQYSEYGAFLKYGESVSFDNCWFENLNVSVAVTASTSGLPSKSINIINSRFANASGFGSLWNLVKNSKFKTNGIPNGTCISVEGGSEVNVQNNYNIVSTISNVHYNNFFIRNYGNDSDINASGNTFQVPSLSKTFGINNKTVDVVNNGIESKRHKFITVNTSTSNIKEINSSLSAGETITIRAAGTITFDNSKNLLFSKPITLLNPFILYDKETATFMKTDDTYTPDGNVYYNETWQLISVNRVN